MRESPRALAQRPLPSITSAMWLGTAPRGKAGGRAPDGCGGGGSNRGTPAPYGGSGRAGVGRPSIGYTWTHAPTFVLYGLGAWLGLDRLRAVAERMPLVDGA